MWCKQDMKIDDEFHQKAILVCIDELASRPSPIMVSVVSYIFFVNAVNKTLDWKARLS